MTLKSSLKVNLLLDDITNAKLDVSWEGVVSSAGTGGSVKSSVSEVVVLTGKEDLEEFLETKSSVTIVVKEHHKSMGL